MATATLIDPDPLVPLRLTLRAALCDTPDVSDAALDAVISAVLDAVQPRPEDLLAQYPHLAVDFLCIALGVSVSDVLLASGLDAAEYAGLVVTLLEEPRCRADSLSGLWSLTAVVRRIAESRADAAAWYASTPEAWTCFLAGDADALAEIEARAWADQIPTAGHLPEAHA